MAQWKAKREAVGENTTCVQTDSRHQPFYRWNNANRPAQQQRPSHQHSNSID
jgi:hypothetical protein